MVSNRIRTASRVALVGSLLCAACSSGGSEQAIEPLPVTNVTSPTTVLANEELTTAVNTPETVAGDPDAPIETSDPNVISRRTEGIDVLVLPDGVQLPAGYSQAAVPVDAFAASELTISTPTDPSLADVPTPPAAFESDQPAVLDGTVAASVSILSCRLVAVWALPHPDEIVVGYEEYPGLTCVVPLEHIATFEIPATGTNSEGTWDYSFMVPIVPLRKVGPSD